MLKTLEITCMTLDAVFFSVQTVKVSVSISASGLREASTAPVMMATSCVKMEQHVKV